MNNNINLTKLREAREKKGLSLAQVAKYLDMSKSSVWFHEQNRVAIPANVLFEVCKLYGITPNDLMLTEKGGGAA
ncbi:helix-turn-helix domain-containing protein [Phascolarctobacterium sp.]